ncbi:MAG TPA: hypothetical protein VMX54_02510 [Vicinamibacteria bacterium]|nr:hypothetical protein [Vicinamibacteria bacterium]
MADPSSAPDLGDEIARAQEQLGRALLRARIGEDPALANQVRELGERAAHLMAGLLRMSRMHSPDNSAFAKPTEDLARALAQLHDLLGSVHLVAVEDQVYVNEIRIRTGEKVSSIRELSGELQRHNVGGITFHAPLGGAAIRQLVGALAAAPAPREPRNTLARALAAAGVEDLELLGRYRFRMADEGGGTEESHDARGFLERMMVAADEAFQNLAAGRSPNALPLRRLVVELLERGLINADVWESPEPDGFVAQQVRVTRLALLLGTAVGLPAAAVQDLGVAALYHDSGYAACEPDAAAAATLAEHPARGARLLLRQKGFHEGKMRRVLSVLQHHRDASASPRPGLFGRILRIAEDYDTLVRGGAAPPGALAAMAKWVGTRYDPVLLQLLVNRLGAYPPGTLVRVPDGRIFRVAQPTDGRAESFSRPLARAVRLADGAAAPSGGRPVDLGGVALAVVAAR